jgi:hypothetical protein
MVFRGLQQCHARQWELHNAEPEMEDWRPAESLIETDEDHCGYGLEQKVKLELGQMPEAVINNVAESATLLL